MGKKVKTKIAELLPPVACLTLTPRNSSKEYPFIEAAKLDQID